MILRRLGNTIANKKNTKKELYEIEKNQKKRLMITLSY